MLAEFHWLRPEWLWALPVVGFLSYSLARRRLAPGSWQLVVDEALASRAYEDTALPIGLGQTISQPFIVARMTEALLAGFEGEKVLEIGTGCGCNVICSLYRAWFSHPVPVINTRSISSLFKSASMGSTTDRL